MKSARSGDRLRWLYVGSAHGSSNVYVMSQKIHPFPLAELKMS